MGRLAEIRIPRYPECWETCGSCAAGDVEVVQVLVQPGERVERLQNVIVVDSGKTALDIPTDQAGLVREVRVRVGDRVEEGATILVLETE
jgi:biotin carboxyl carrier protein